MLALKAVAAQKGPRRAAAAEIRMGALLRSFLLLLRVGNHLCVARFAAQKAPALRPRGVTPRQISAAAIESKDMQLPSSRISYFTIIGSNKRQSLLGCHFTIDRRYADVILI